MSIFKKGIFFGISVCDISTGDFYSAEIKEENNFERLLDEISRYSPSEIIANEMLYDCGEEISKIKNVLMYIFLLRRGKVQRRNRRNIYAICA